jgi:hypothetical protein
VSTVGWILLIALFLGAHLWMHRGHGTYGRRFVGGPPRNGHQHGTKGDEGSNAQPEPGRHRHTGC